MPIFCYRCQDCNLLFERLVRPPEKEPEACPDCKGKIKKEFVPFSIGKSETSSDSTGSSCVGCQASSCSNCRK